MSVENQLWNQQENFIWETGNLSWEAKSHLGYKKPFSVTKSKSEFLCEVQLQFWKMEASFMKSRDIFKNENFIREIKSFSVHQISE